MSPRKVVLHLSQVTPRKGHILLPLLMMTALYWLSSLPGIPVDNDASVHRLFLWVPPSLQNLLHIPTYAILTLAWYWALWAWLRVPLASAASACVIASLFGLFDEWHQSFVPGRYASLTDVVLNIVGVAGGIWLAVQMRLHSRVLQQPRVAERRRGHYWTYPRE